MLSLTAWKHMLEGAMRRTSRETVSALAGAANQNTTVYKSDDLKCTGVKKYNSLL